MVKAMSHGSALPYLSRRYFARENVRLEFSPTTEMIADRITSQLRLQRLLRLKMLMPLMNQCLLPKRPGKWSVCRDKKSKWQHGANTLSDGDIRSFGSE